MDPNVIDTVRWIVDILDKHSVEYQISGGLAAKIYGSPRELNDIDIDVREKDFSKILPDISDYLTFGPARFNDGKFDCELMSLTYKGCDIDISGTDTLRMSNKERTTWITYPDFKFNTLDIEWHGIRLKVVHPRKLAEYKRELDGENQLVDIDAVEKYLKDRAL